MKADVGNGMSAIEQITGFVKYFDDGKYIKINTETIDATINKIHDKVKIDGSEHEKLVGFDVTIKFRSVFTSEC